MKKKRILFITIFFCIMLCGCSSQNNTVSEDEGIMSPEKYVYEGKDIITYKNIVYADCEKSLFEEDLNDLDIIIYRRFENGDDFYIFDFDNGYVFNQSSYVTIVDNSIRSADEELKAEIDAYLQRRLSHG